MLRTLILVICAMVAAAGAAVFGSEGQRTRAAAPAQPAAIVQPAPQAAEARWTTTPVRIADTRAHVRLPAIERPRDINLGLTVAAPARIPAPMPRPPSTEHLLEADRGHLTSWCRSDREARRACEAMRRTARPTREARTRRGGEARTVVRIDRSDIRPARGQRYATPAMANAAIERSPNYDLLR